MISLYLFPHQDDEFGVFWRLTSDVEHGRRVKCVFMTCGVAKGKNSVRNAESLRVLRALGVKGQDVIFAGEALAINDGKLVDALERVVGWVGQFLSEHPGIDLIYVPAWEGGHPDHDALHAAVVSVCAKAGVIAKLRQFPLYNGIGLSGPFFRVLSPIGKNGTVHREVIPLRQRLRFLWFCCCYRSQWKSWVGLLPFVAIHYVFKGVQEFQPASCARLREAPHSGVLYYERRGLFSAEVFFSRLHSYCGMENWR